VANALGEVTAQRRGKPLFGFLLMGLLAALGVAVILSVSVGAVALPFGKIVRIIFHNIFGLGVADWKAVEAQIVWEFRLPRVLLAAIVGLWREPCYRRWSEIRSLILTC
jgi:iron complex transport system permease protein